MKNVRNKIIEVKDIFKRIQGLLVITPIPTTLTKTTSLPPLLALKPIAYGMGELLLKNFKFHILICICSHYKLLKNLKLVWPESGRSSYLIAQIEISWIKFTGDINLEGAKMYVKKCYKFCLSTPSIPISSVFFLYYLKKKKRKKRKKKGGPEHFITWYYFLF